MDKVSLIVSKNFHVLTDTPLYYVLLAVTLIVSANYALKPKKQKYAAAPIACVEGMSLAAARERFRTAARGMLREGHEKYKELPFYVPSPLGERLMIPAKYVEELKTAPVDEVDFVGTFFEVHTISDVLSIFR
jgi:ent-kaurene oxidase